MPFQQRRFQLPLKCSRAAAHKKGRLDPPPVLIINPLKLKTVFQRAREYKLYIQNNAGRACRQDTRQNRMHLDIYSAAANATLSI